MYLQHFGLAQFPFRNTPDPRFFFETSRHNEALASLIYAVEQRRGFVLLSGEIGSGKTLVTHMLLSHLEDHAQVALIRNTHLNSNQLIRLICDEFGVQHQNHADKAGMLLSLNQFLVQQLAEDRLVVIVIDEAQNLSDKVLEELRMLSNLETSSEKLLQIVLVGQPELRDKVSQPQLEQLRQRIALTYHLDPLTPEEVGGYIAHRLRVAAGEGGHRVAFTPDAVAKIAKFSRGTPRVINGLCDNALLFGFTASTCTIDEGLIDRVLRQSMHLAPRQRIGGTVQPTHRPEAGPGTSSVGRPNPVEDRAGSDVAPPAPPSAREVRNVGDEAAVFPRPSAELREEMSGAMRGPMSAEPAGSVPPPLVAESPAAPADEGGAEKKSRSSESVAVGEQGRSLTQAASDRLSLAWEARREAGKPAEGGRVGASPGAEAAQVESGRQAVEAPAEVAAREPVSDPAAASALAGAEQAEAKATVDAGEGSGTSVGKPQEEPAVVVPPVREVKTLSIAMAVPPELIFGISR